jgi:NADH-quinone oxidoreductase subunit N
VNPPDLNLSVVGPVVATGVGAMFVLLGEVLLSRAKTFMGRPLNEPYIGSLLALVSMASLVAAAYMAAAMAQSGTVLPFNADNPMFQLDGFSAMITALIAFAALLSCALSMHYLDELHINHGEFYALILFSVSGMMLMVAAVDMLPIFLGLELMSIPIYVLAGFDRRRLRSNESALKYFLIGSFASALLLYGVALLYGLSGSTAFVDIRAAFDPESPLALAGLALIVVGFAFKISSVPFHQWTPDVYEGAPSAVTAFMSVTVKLAAFAALLRVLALSFEPLGDLLGNVLWVLAALSVIVGNVMAVIQENVKRLLAYSSIAHAGYLLIGFVPGTADGYSAVVFYLICYVFMNLGAFGVVVVLAHRGQDCERMESLAGLAQSRPGLAAMMTLFLLALAGIPGTAGFVGKFLVFQAAVEAGYVPLAILGVMMSVVSVYYYLRIPVLMYMREPGDERPRAGYGTGEALVLAVCAAGVVYLGISPNGAVFGGLDVISWARDGIGILFESAAPVADVAASVSR